MTVSLKYRYKKTGLIEFVRRWSAGVLEKWIIRSFERHEQKTTIVSLERKLPRDYQGSQYNYGPRDALP